ncbi:hypothetical protein TorRG33x02_128810 [Trema orientale]|uniref:Uncharacterized protein n=1 Tax=Trema orientale TaxID=63057 RepID=A0A2P5F0L6_TREOI|nr:hypothetical protein TorRG33x02_128810 [Trema orientale]
MEFERILNMAIAVIIRDPTLLTNLSIGDRRSAIDELEEMTGDRTPLTNLSMCDRRSASNELEERFDAVKEFEWK